MILSNKLRREVVVHGDAMIAWNFFQIQSRKENQLVSRSKETLRACWQRAGAFLTADLLHGISAEFNRLGVEEWAVHSPEAIIEAPCPGNQAWPYRYTIWKPFSNGDRPPEDAPKIAWRVSEFLGIDRASEPANSPVYEDSPEATLVVLDGDGQGIRDKPDNWPAAITTPGSHPWVVYRMANPIAQGSLWNHLLENHAERLIILLSVDDLRHSEVQISRELSWERTAQDVAWELVYNPCINAISRCAWLVIVFPGTGAVLGRGRQKVGTSVGFSLIFDPKYIEGGWESSFPGGMVGYDNCMTASLAGAVMRDPFNPDIAAGVKSGIQAQRMLHLLGYELDKEFCCAALPVGKNRSSDC